MINNSKKNELIHIVIKNNNICLPETFMKKNNIKNGGAYSLIYDSSKIIVSNDNISNYLSWMIKSFVEKYVIYYPQDVILITSRERVISAFGKNASSYFDKQLSNNIKKFIASRSECFRYSYSIKLFQDSDSLFKCELVTLFDNRTSIGSIIIISNDNDRRIYSELLFEVFRFVSVISYRKK